MKSDIKYTYEKEEVIATVLKEHEKEYPAPVGMVYKAEMRYTDQIEITAVEVEEREEVAHA